MTEEDCQYTDVNGVAIHEPKLQTMCAQLTAAHFLLIALTLLLAMTAGAALAYVSFMSFSPQSSSSPSPQLQQLLPFTSPALAAFLPSAASAAVSTSPSCDSIPAVHKPLPAALVPLAAVPAPPPLPPRIEFGIERNLVPAATLTALHYEPYMNLTAEVPTCWSAAQYSRWRHGVLQTLPLSARTASVVSRVMFSVMTGSVNHLTRAAMVMCSYGQLLQPGQLFMHSDDQADESWLPLVGSVKKRADGTCDHSCSQHKSDTQQTLPCPSLPLPLSDAVSLPLSVVSLCAGG